MLQGALLLVSYQAFHLRRFDRFDPSAQHHSESRCRCLLRLSAFVLRAHGLVDHAVVVVGVQTPDLRPSTNVNGDGVVMVHDGDVFVSTNTGRGEWDCGGLSIASSLSVVKW
jgi:hypothetical protein